MVSLNKTTYLILIVGLFSLIQAAFTGITYDESYYWVYSNFLDFGYFDHPPVVAVLIKIGELFGHGELFTRISFSLMMTLTIFLMTEMVHPKNKNILIYAFISFPLLVSAGFLALPDTPLLFFSVLFWYQTQKYIENDNLKNVLILSLVISLLFYSKYHGLLVVLFTLLGQRDLLKRKSLYVIICLVIIFYLPHMLWQYQNEFVSFKFHLTGRREKHFDISNIFNYLIGVVFVCGFIVFPSLFRSALKSREKFYKIYQYNSFGFIVFVFLMSFRNAIELNWVVTASAAFLILSLQNELKNMKKVFILLTPSFIILLIFRIILINDFGLREKVDRLNEIHGWDERFKEFYAMDLNDKIVFDNYQYGARFSYFKNTIYPVKHLRSRESHYSLLDLVSRKKILETDQITFVGTKNTLNSYKIETNYKDPIYVKTNTTIKEIKDKYE